MVVPAFGWSAGDIVKSIQIVVKVCEAFKEAGGATTSYAETTAFLESFARVLKSIKDFADNHASAKYTPDIVDQIKLVDGPYCEFEKYLLGFKPSLAADSTQHSYRKAPKKAKWAIKELSNVSGKVSQLKKAVSDPLLCIEPLLLLQSM